MRIASRLFTLVVCALIFATASMAEERATYEDLWNDAITQPNAKISETDNATSVTLVTASNDLTIYFFSKPKTPPHPGVVLWITQHEGQGYCSKIASWYFGPSGGRQAFVNWLEAIKIKYDEFARRVGMKCPEPAR